ncbi:MAG: family 1 glycosylhydrolase [Microthrixaceae bacterium]
MQSKPGGEATAARYSEIVEDEFIRSSVDDDFVGVQSYTCTVFGPDGVIRNDLEESRTQMGWEYWPEALGQAIRHASELSGGLPILVTENGIATDDDERRVAYTTGALKALMHAMSDGIDVRGYLHWSLLDNYEWGSYGPTFGLVSWDPETFERTVKPSALWLGDVARQRRLSA